MINIKKAIIEFGTKKISSSSNIDSQESVDSILTYEELRFWIMHREFLPFNSVPKYFGFSIDKVDKQVRENSLPSINESIRKKLTEFFLEKMIATNETAKIAIAQINKKIGMTKRNNGINEKEKILFLTNSMQLTTPEEGYARKMGSMINIVMNEKKYEPYILAYIALKRSNLPKINRNTEKITHFVYENANKHLLSKSWDIAGEMNKKWKKIPESAKKEAGGSLWPFIKNELNYYFSKEMMFTIIFHYEVLKRIVYKERIKAIVLQGASGIHEKIAMCAAHQCRIPLIILQHGFGMALFENELMKKGIFAAFGKRSIKNLTDLGIKRNNIAITGPAILDGTIEFYKNHKKESVKKTEKKQKEVLFLTHGYYIYGLMEEKKYFDYIKRYITEIKNAGKNDEIKITFKLHPEEIGHEKKYLDIIKKEGHSNVNLVSTPGIKTLYPLIINSDIVINFGSTAALEAMLLDKNVITIRGFHEEGIMNYENAAKIVYENNWGSMVIKKDDSLTFTVKKVLEDKKTKKKLSEGRKKYLKEVCYKTDGCSSKRAVELVYKQIKNRQIEKIRKTKMARK